MAITAGMIANLRISIEASVADGEFNEIGAADIEVRVPFHASSPDERGEVTLSPDLDAFQATMDAAVAAFSASVHASRSPHGPCDRATAD